MKKLVFAFAIGATLVVALLSTGNVFAQGTTPTNPTAPGTGAGYGRGMMGGRGGATGSGVGAGMGLAGSQAGTGQGILHDTMIAVFSQKLGISVDDLNARLAKGETIAQIASAKGLTADQFTALMKDARSQAIDQAVKDGTLTQAQADWMKTRVSAANGMNGARMGQGAGRGMGRGSAARGGGFGDPANCPYFTQSN